MYVRPQEHTRKNMHMQIWHVQETFSLICKLSCNLHQILATVEAMKLLMLSQEYERAASRQENIEQIRAWRQAET